MSTTKSIMSVGVPEGTYIISDLYPESSKAGLYNVNEKKNFTTNFAFAKYKTDKQLKECEFNLAMGTVLDVQKRQWTCSALQNVDYRLVKSCGVILYDATTQRVLIMQSDTHAWIRTFFYLKNFAKSNYESESERALAWQQVKQQFEDMMPYFSQRECELLLKDPKQLLHGIAKQKAFESDIVPLIKEYHGKLQGKSIFESWYFPKGNMRKEESNSAETARREFEEEFGVTIVQEAFKDGARFDLPVMCHEYCILPAHNLVNTFYLICVNEQDLQDVITQAKQDTIEYHGHEFVTLDKLVVHFGATHAAVAKDLILKHVEHAFTLASEHLQVKHKKKSFVKKQQEPIVYPTEKPFKAFITNLPVKYGKPDIAKLFHPLKAQKIFIPRDAETKQNKNFAFAEFSTLEDLKSAIACSGKDMKGNAIGVQLAKPQASKPIAVMPQRRTTTTTTSTAPTFAPTQNMFAALQDDEDE